MLENQYNTPGINLPNHEKHTFKNGLTVILTPSLDLPTVNFAMLVGTGASSVSHLKAGVSFLTSEMLKKGSGGKSAIEFSEAVDFLGGSVGLMATHDYSILGGTFLSKDVNIGLNLLSDMILSPRFLPTELERVKRLLLNAIRGIHDNPSALCSLAFQKIFYGEKHPYALPTHGLEETIKNLTTDDIIDYFNSHYSPIKSILTATGQFKMDVMLKQIEQCFSGWDPINSLSNKKAIIPLKKSKRITLIHKPDLSQTQIRIGSPGINKGHQDTFSVKIANSVFGGMFTSRLVRSIRVKQGLTYSINSGFTTMKHQGAFTISTFTQNKTVREILDAILQEIRSFKSGDIRQEEIDAAINYHSGLYPMSLETPKDYASQILNIEFYNLSKDWVSNYIPNLQAVTKKDVLQVIDKYFTEKLNIVLLTNADDVTSSLKNFNGIEIIESIENNGLIS